ARIGDNVINLISRVMRPVDLPSLTIFAGRAESPLARADPQRGPLRFRRGSFWCRHAGSIAPGSARSLTGVVQNWRASLYGSRALRLAACRSSRRGAGTLYKPLFARPKLGGFFQLQRLARELQRSCIVLRVMLVMLGELFVRLHLKRIFRTCQIVPD